MSTMLSPSRQRFFVQATPPAAAPSRLVPPASVPARPHMGAFPTSGPAARDGGGTRAYTPSAAGAAPPARPRPPVDQRPTFPEPPRRALERAWLTWQMPVRIQAQARDALRKTLGWRAQYCQPLEAPKTPPEYTRFGLVGEQLPPQAAITLRKTLRAEIRQMVRTMEGSQSRTERNRLLAMHSIRLGQLCAELEQRGIDVLEEVRNGLTVLWD